MHPEPQQKTYRLETYGCQMNKAESEALEIALREAGYAAAADGNGASLVILNTCAVRATAEQRIHGRLGEYRHLKQRRPFTLAVMGCMGERLKQDLRRKYPEIDIIIGTFQKSGFLEALRLAESGNGVQDRWEHASYEFAAVHSRGDFKAFVPIMHGCNNYCSYCIVPYVRGPEVSRAPHDILSEMKLIRERGVREVTLLGQNVNSYAYGVNGDRLDFAGLLDLVAGAMPPGVWIRFLTSHPKDMRRELIEKVASSPLFCRHVHLPAQHGSDRILSLMNRGYTRRQYIDLARALKNTVSGVTITTDILIGFPSETEDDVKRTLDLMEEVAFDDAYTYYYNPREGTKAFGFEDTVPREEKLSRLQRVIEVNLRVKRERQRARVGRSTTVLVEGVSKKNETELLGRTEHDEMIVFPGPRSLIGTFVSVMPRDLQGTTFRGRLA